METLVFLQIGLLLGIVLAVTLILVVYGQSQAILEPNSKRPSTSPARKRQTTLLPEPERSVIHNVNIRNIR